MSERGIYQFENRAKQLLRFDGDKYGNITPTDIDATIDYHGNTWVFHEAKMKGKDVPPGQKIYFEHFIEMLQQFNRYRKPQEHYHAIAIISEHEVFNSDKPIYLSKDLYVREFLSTETYNKNMKNKGWRPPIQQPMKAVDMERQYISLFGR